MGESNNKTLMAMSPEERREHMRQLQALGAEARRQRAAQEQGDSDRMSDQLEMIRAALDDFDPDNPASNVLAVMRQRCFEVLAELTFSPNENVRHKATTMILEYTDGRPVQTQPDDGAREIVYMTEALAPDDRPAFVPA